MTSSHTDSFNLHRFVMAQEPIYDQVRAELTQGEKRSHWMWFIFPQIRGLGASSMAQKFAIESADEALAYLAHPVLGPRLLECTRLVNGVQRRSLHEIFGSPDDMKFRSSMTLFAHVSPRTSEFTAALQKYCRGESDARTVEILNAQKKAHPA